MNTERLDKIINDLERLHSDARDILNAYVAQKLCNKPAASFGQAKAYYVSRPAGSALNYVAALRHVRKYLKK
jgi:hypothetical protein